MEGTMTTDRTYTFGEVASLVRTNLYCWGAVVILFCTVPAYLLFAAVPKFESMFKGFGADLPDGTVFLLRWPLVLWIIPALAVLLLIASIVAPPEKAVARHKGIVGSFAVMCGLSLVVQGLAAAALYAPFFRLGAVI
jgi:hypothetical protein